MSDRAEFDGMGSDQIGSDHIGAERDSADRDSASQNSASQDSVGRGEGEYGGDGAGSMVELPPLFPEDHVCPDCALSYSELRIEAAVAMLDTLACSVTGAALAVPADARRIRPAPRIWSVAEYVCHLRDVYVTSTIRLHRTRVEERPALEPMFNDLRTVRFRYRNCDVPAVLADLDRSVTGFRDEIARTGVDEWDRVATRLPGEVRTARWLVRQATHEGMHHLSDIRDAAAKVAADTD